MSIVPPKAIGAIILSFVISEAVPILLYLSWSNGNTPTNLSNLACLKSSLPIESCNPSVIGYRFQQLYGMNQVLSVVSLLHLFHQGLSIEHFNSSWACLKLSKTIPVYLCIQIEHIVSYFHIMSIYLNTGDSTYLHGTNCDIAIFMGVAMMMALFVWFVRNLSNATKTSTTIMAFLFIFEILPILLYTSWGNPDVDEGLPHLMCIDSIGSRQQCTPYVQSFGYQQLYGLNYVASFASLLQLVYQGLSMEHLHHTWTHLNNGKLYLLLIITKTTNLTQFKYFTACTT